MWCIEVYDVLPFSVACLSTRFVMSTVKQNKKWLWIRRKEWISYLSQVCLCVLPSFIFLFFFGIMVCRLMSQRKHGLCCMIRRPHSPQNKSLPQLLARLLYYSRKTILAPQPPTPVPPTLERKGGCSPELGRGKCCQRWCWGGVPKEVGEVAWIKGLGSQAWCFFTGVNEFTASGQSVKDAAGFSPESPIMCVTLALAKHTLLCSNSDMHKGREAGWREAWRQAQVFLPVDCVFLWNGCQPFFQNS